MRPQSQGAETHFKRGMMFNRSPGMSEIFGGGIEVTAPANKQSIGAECTFGAPRQTTKGIATQSAVDFKPSSKDQLCDNCLNDELLQYKRQKDAEQQRKEKEEHLKYLQNLKDMEERENHRKGIKKQQYSKEAAESVKEAIQRKQRESDPTIQEFFTKMNQEAEKSIQKEKIRKNQEKMEYNSELSQQCGEKKQKIENDKKLNREEELSKVGLPLDSYKGDRYSNEKKKQKRILEEQMVEHQLKKLRESQDEPRAPTKIEELTKELEQKRAVEDQKVKDIMKKGYQTFLQEQEIQTQKNREKREQRRKDVLDEDLAYKTQVLEEQKVEKEKKKLLGDYLLSQIQSKPKEIQQIEEEVVEHASRPDPTKPKPRNNPREVKNSNLRQMQEREMDKAYEQEKQKKLDEEMLQKAKKEEELYQKQEQLKKEAQKRTMEESQRKIEVKKSQLLNMKKGNKSELEYYDKMNEQFKILIKEEQMVQKEKFLDYKSQIQAQIMQNDEAKRKKELEKLEEQSGGLPLGKDPNPYIDHRKFKREIERQYRESQLNKSPQESELIPTESLPPLGEEYKSEWSKEEQRKKAQQRADFLKAQEQIKQSKIEKEKCRQMEKEECEHDAQTIKQLQEAERKRDRDQKQNLASFLSDQIKADATKKKADRSKWMDEKTQKHAEQIEKRVQELKNEIRKCIKCNTPLPKAKPKQFPQR